MRSRTGRFGPSDRLLKPRDFKRVSGSGERLSSRDFVLLRARTISRDPSRIRLGITTSRRVGNAVARNRVRRCVREWFRHHRDELEPGHDWVVIARRSASDLPGREISRALSRMCGLERVQ